MSISNFVHVIIQSFLVTVLIISLLSVAKAQVRTSSNYQMQSDSVNFAGGLSTSTNYDLESTAGEIATGIGTSPTYFLRAGYQQMQEVFLSMTAVSPVVMVSDIGGLTGGESNGTTSVSVLTDSPSGYQMTISAENSPAMQKGVDVIADYVPIASPDLDMSFSVLASDAHFGFSVQGNDASLKWLNDTSDCGSGTNSTSLVCWDGLATSEKMIATGPANQPAGATTTLHFKVGIGSTATVVAGDYYATTTLTAIPI